MKTQLLLLLGSAVLASCNPGSSATQQADHTSIIGTWQLVSNKIITQGDTVTAFPVKGKEEVMIKMFNATHFSFFRHDLQQGKGADAVYDTGAGTYQLSGSDYQEHLQYCNAREWEGQRFSFKLQLKNDTLVQSGVEKIDSLKINREIIETYVKVK